MKLDLHGMALTVPRHTTGNPGFKRKQTQELEFSSNLTKKRP